MGFQQQNSGSRWVKAVAAQGMLRAVALQCVDLVQIACDRHGLRDPLQRKALAQGLVGGFLLASYLKSGERMNLKIHGSGVYGGAVIDAYPDGRVRGYLLPPRPYEEAATLMVGEGGAPQVFGPWGMGTLSVLRTREMERQLPYLGSVPLITGHLAKDLSFYWLQSEQIPTGVCIEVDVAEDGTFLAAGGFLLQVMPGATDEQIAMVELGIQKYEALTQSDRQENFRSPVPEARAEQSLIVLLNQILGEQGVTLLEQKSLILECRCSWERVSEAVTLLNAQELEEMIQSGEATDVGCDLCGEKYIFGPAELGDCLEKVRVRS